MSDASPMGWLPGGPILGHEVPVRDDRVSMKIDTVSRTGAGAAVIEYKSIDGNAFRYSDLPYTHHLVQGHTYATFYPGAEVVWIVYLGKNGRIEEFSVPVTEETTTYIREYIARLDGLLERYQREGELPPPSPQPFKWCDYRGTSFCCADEQEKRAAPVPQVPAGDGDQGDERGVPQMREQGGEEGPRGEEG